MHLSKNQYRTAYEPKPTHDMAKKDNEPTPMMRQFFSFKAQHPDALLLFRCGDFYETYMQDAVDASRILGITLTRRNNGGSKGQAEMAGFPHHALDTYLPRLIRAGRRVAVCDQLEDPKLTKKLVKRGITELVTPGVAMADNVLDCRQNNFLAAVNFGKAACGLALLDISTGEFLTGEGSFDYVGKLLANFAPKEVLYEKGRGDDFRRLFGQERRFTFELDDWAFAEQGAEQKLRKHFGVDTLKGFGIDHLHSGICAAGAIMHYLEMTQHTHIDHITRISRIEEERYVRLDGFTVRSLELLNPMQQGGASLLDVLDRTSLPMGARLLRRWLVFPLRDAVEIGRRLDAVQQFVASPALRDELELRFASIGDLERVISKAAVGRISPREMVQLRNALEALKPVRQACLEADDEGIRAMGQRIDTCDALAARIRREMREDPPQQVGKGGLIRDGVDSELDELRQISTHSKDYLLKIQQRETEQTGISSLKIGYNNVFGYYLEVRNIHKDKVPQDWVRKQTLANAERYITEELKQYEEKILGAEDKILAIEARLFAQLVEETQKYVQPIQTDATLLARIDCLLSFAKTSIEHRYARPQIDGEAIVTDITQGRHPVIETQLPVGEAYVPNDIYLDDKRQQIMMITGPNMAGKSALLRQTALITLMAQAGCFVPAEKARIGLVDKVFTRVGASDNISSGESTFMVEMTEAANILNNATPRSLVLFDELGRGTSTYDGISIAWAIVEYLHEQPRARARTLFATHYHELNEMERSFDRIKNYNVSVRESGGKVIFLRKLVRGGSEHSFGIHVAEIAGMPKSIVRRAEAILRQLEADNAQTGITDGAASQADDGRVGQGAQPLPTDMRHAKAKAKGISRTKDGMQLSFFQLDDPVLCQVRDEILGLDINNLTPVEALNKLNEIKKIVKG